MLGTGKFDGVFAVITSVGNSQRYLRRHYFSKCSQLKLWVLFAPSQDFFVHHLCTARYACLPLPSATAINSKRSHVAAAAVGPRLGGVTELAAPLATVRSTGERTLHRSLRVKRAPAPLCRTLRRFLALNPAKRY